MPTTSECACYKIYRSSGLRFDLVIGTNTGNASFETDGELFFLVT